MELTEREQEIYTLLSNHGLTNREMGKILRLGERTIERHIGSLLAKLGVENRVQAALTYHGILRREDNGQ